MPESNCVEIVQQIKYYPIEKLEEKLKINELNIIYYAYIVHNDENNIHFHCMLKLKSRRNFIDVANWFDIDIARLEKPKVTGKYAYLYMCQYLVHKNDPLKVQYKPTEVVANFDFVKFIDLEPQKEKKIKDNTELIQDLVAWIDGYINTFDLACKYGRDFIKNMQKYNDCAVALKLCVDKEKDDLL